MAVHLKSPNQFMAWGFFVNGSYLTACMWLKDEGKSYNY
jgi:hypothetical protein